MLTYGNRGSQPTQAWRLGISVWENDDGATSAQNGYPESIGPSLRTVVVSRNARSRHPCDHIVMIAIKWMQAQFGVPQWYNEHGSQLVEPIWVQFQLQSDNKCTVNITKDGLCHCGNSIRPFAVRHWVAIRIKGRAQEWSTLDSTDENAAPVISLCCNGRRTN